MLGATLSPLTLTMDKATTATIQNRGNVPVTVTADARLGTLQAVGYRVTVEPPTLEPMQTATVTLRQTRAGSPVDLTLLLTMGAAEAQGGMDATALAFPVPVDNLRATPRTTAMAWAQAIVALLRVTFREWGAAR